MSNSIVIGLILVVQCVRFFKSVDIVFTEGAFTYSDYLQMLAETLFYVVALTFADFWHIGGGNGIPAIMIGLFLGASLLVNIRNVVFGETVDFKVVFAQPDLSQEAMMGVKNIIVSLVFLTGLGFFALLWLGGLFAA